MKRILSHLALAAVLALVLAAPAAAHFGMIIPDLAAADMDHKSATLAFSFSHPFAGQGMDLIKPAKAGVVFEGKTTDLLGSLTPSKVMDHDAFSLKYAFKRPGVYTFFMEPQPYWEPAEDLSIIHYTKVLIPAFGGDTGWGEPIGMKTEIVPLVRPFGNYAGGVFSGRVLLDGKPVPGAEVEVELYNQGRFSTPSEYHETQVVLADDNGVFTFACPQPGWWGFAALAEGDFTLPALSGPDKGKAKGVEIGAVFWTYMSPWQ